MVRPRIMHVSIKGVDISVNPEFVDLNVDDDVDN